MNNVCLVDCVQLFIKKRENLWYSVTVQEGCVSEIGVANMCFSIAHDILGIRLKAHINKHIRLLRVNFKLKCLASLAFTNCQ